MKNSRLLYSLLHAHPLCREFNTTTCPVTYLLELTVVNITRNDSGQYSVVITNRAGTVTPSFTHLLEGI